MNTGTQKMPWMVGGLLLVLVTAVAVQGYLLYGIYRQHPNLLPEMAGGPVIPVLKAVDRPVAQDPPPKTKSVTPPGNDLWLTPPDVDDWNPFAEMQMMQERMSRMFDDAFGRLRMSPNFPSLDEHWMFAPQIDLDEEGTNYIIRMDIPGAEKSDISVHIEGQTLTVSGKTAETREETDGGTVIRRERRSGNFRRVITLPGPAKSEQMRATYENGVLTITVPKSADAPITHRITIT